MADLPAPVAPSPAAPTSAPLAPGELALLRASRVGRLATLTATGDPVACAVRYQVRSDGVVLLPADAPGVPSARDVARDPRAALLVDEGADPGSRGVLLRGRLSATTSAAGTPLLELRATRVVSWGV